MPESRERLLRVIKQCFTEREWELLTKENAFAEEIQRVKSLDDVERICKDGALWLSEQEEKERRSREARRRRNDS